PAFQESSTPAVVKSPPNPGSPAAPTPGSLGTRASAAPRAGSATPGPASSAPTCSSSVCVATAFLGIFAYWASLGYLFAPSYVPSPFRPRPVAFFVCPPTPTYLFPLATPDFLIAPPPPKTQTARPDPSGAPSAGSGEQSCAPEFPAAGWSRREFRAA